MAAFSAAFLEQPHGTDRNGLLDRFAHVIEGKSGYRYCRQGFHLDTRFGFSPGHRFDAHAGVDEFDRNVQMRQGQWMAQGYQLPSLLPCLYTGNSRHLKRISLWNTFLAEQPYGRWRHLDKRFGARHTSSLYFASDINHPRPAFFVEVRQFVFSRGHLHSIIGMN
jgi:hypothetical protein